MDQQDLTSPGSLKAFYRRVIGHFGEDSQSDAIIEEAAELIHAICKYRQKARKGADTTKAREFVVEEIVDMQIMLDQARLIFLGDSQAADMQFEVVKKEKLARLAEQVGKAAI